MLTDAAIRKAKPSDKPRKLTDGEGLYLYLTPAGGKFWRFKYRFGGKERLLSIGPYPGVSLADARKARDAAKDLLRQGKDPGVVKKQKAAVAIADAGNTFEPIARRWHDIQKGQWSEVHAKDVLDSLEADVFPKIGRFCLGDITPPMILNDVLRPIEERGAIETAHRTRQRISAVFVFAIAEGIGENDPAAIVKGALKPVVRGRQPAITDLERVREMLRAAEAIPAHPVTKLGHRLLALTAVRIGTLRRTPWEEIDGSDLWLIPSERMKLERRHKEDETRDFLVPLSRQAMEVIEALRPLTGRGKLLLPGARHAHRPMSENAIGYLLNRAGYFGRHVPHGWRSSFSTIMNDRYRADSKIIDLMLAHVPKDKVEGAYNRAAYIDRRRELIQIWADLLLEGMPPAASLISGRRR